MKVHRLDLIESILFKVACWYVWTADELQKSLGPKLEKTGDVEVKVRGVEKLVKTGREQSIVWHSFYNDDG